MLQRKAANGPEFVAALKSGVGLDVDVISGEEEAKLAALSAYHNFALDGVCDLIFDIGGGSLELIIAKKGHATEELHSLELGAVFLTETYLRKDPVDQDELQKLRKHVRKALKKAFTGEERISVPCLVGSGGTVASMAAMAIAARQEDYHSCQGYELLRGDLAPMLAMLVRRNNKERRSVPGLSADRADIIVAGVTVVDEVMDFFGANTLKVNERGIREGLILRALGRKQALPEDAGRRSWRNSVLEFASAHHFDEKHSLQVARLSLAIFDSLSLRFGLAAGDLRLLEAAALLHDVGYLINYSSHHKHSYHLIRHADLFDFTPRERELIANIARYHRRSLPKRKHEQFMRLTTEDQLLVARLGGILRLCDGLDRRHNAVVEELDCALSPRTLTVTLRGRDEMSVERFGAKTKGELFHAAFGLSLAIVSESAGGAPRPPLTLAEHRGFPWTTLPRRVSA